MSRRRFAARWSPPLPMGHLWAGCFCPCPHGGNVETRRTRTSRRSLGVLRSETAGAGPSVSGPGDRSGRIWGVVNLPSTAAPAFLHPLVLAVAALRCRKAAYSRHSFTDAYRKDGKQTPAHSSRSHPTPKTNKIHKVTSIKPIPD